MSIDGLKGFPESITQVFPRAEIQLCVVHQIRNSLKYIVSRDQKAFMKDLKLVYKATSKDLAEHYLLELGEKWGKKYPAVIKSWQANWEALSQYFKYPDELRRIIYTTNIVEGFHRQIRKYTKNKGALNHPRLGNKKYAQFSLLEAYELWSDTNSAHALKILQQYTDLSSLNRVRSENMH